MCEPVVCLKAYPDTNLGLKPNPYWRLDATLKRRSSTVPEAVFTSSSGVDISFGWRLRSRSWDRPFRSDESCQLVRAVHRHRVPRGRNLCGSSVGRAHV